MIFDIINKITSIKDDDILKLDIVDSVIFVKFRESLLHIGCDEINDNKEMIYYYLKDKNVRDFLTNHLGYQFFNDLQVCLSEL